MTDALASLSELGYRAHGVSLEYSRSGTDWPKGWRAKVVYTKNERDDLRLTAFGETAEEAIQALADLFEEARKSHWH